MTPGMETATAHKIPRPIMRYHGGKFRLADWIMEFFPDHDTYVEPFGGAASVLMRKPRSPAEVYNDLDDEVVNVFRVLRNPEQALRLKEVCTLTPYARSEFKTAYEPSADPVEQAKRTIFRAAAGFGSAGATKGRTGFRSYSKADRSVTPALDWASYPGAITAFCDRLRGVIIESGNAVDVIDRHDAPGTLFFVDPPYMHETRAMAGNRTYRHEMTEHDHRDLLDRLVRVEGFVVISGYPTKIYEEILIPAGWERFSRAASISGNRGTTMRMECVWINPRCADGLRQRPLF
ncbi:MAG: DNA adenine methylase [Acidithiobacillus ferriphilus]